MNSDLITILTFVLITTFTPGPNNITSASMGILYGYKQSLRFLCGIAVGFFIIMFLSGWVSSLLLQMFPDFENILRIIGAVYILWLAYHTILASYSFDEEQQSLLGFTQGLLLQLLNPKVIVYGLTIYSSFLVNTRSHPIQLLVSAVLLSAVGFCAISTWTLFGSAIRIYLSNPLLKKILNTILALLLVYTAIELSGFFHFFEGVS